MPKALVVHELGAAENMCWQDWSVADPQPNEVRLRHTVVGVNFADYLSSRRRSASVASSPLPLW